MIGLRAAVPGEAAEVLARTLAFNAIEGIAVDEAALQEGIARLLANPELGTVWVIERDGRAIGQAVVTYGYDLEFAGRDSFLTEIWIEPAARGAGAGAAALALLEAELSARDIRALHLQVRPENPARRLYERAGFAASPRIAMTRVLAGRSTTPSE
jgi:GNAT superfamily N-acetyltransferase